MIKNIERLLLLLLPALAFTACTEDEGTEPGNDGAPNLAIFEQSTVAPNDVDVDGTYKIATNNKTEQVYYLAEPTANASADDSYAQKVVSQGTEITLGTDTVSGGYVANVVVKNMVGDYTVSFVAVNGNKRTLKQTTFFGLTWNDVTTGTYHFNRSVAQTYLGAPATETVTLQQLSTDPTQYRFHNLYGEGQSLRFYKTSNTGSDDSGSYTFVRVDAQSTSFTYGSYGTVNVADIATRYNDESYATDTGWGCMLYDDYSYVQIIIQYYVSAGRLGNVFEYFVAN